MELTDPVVLDPAGNDIHAEGERIRAHGPVARVELPGGVRAWSVTGHAAAVRVLNDQRFSKDPRKHWTDYTQGRIGENFPLIGWVLMDNLTTAYGSDHTRLRKLIASAFTPRQVESLRVRIAEIVAGLLDELTDVPPDEVVDLKGRYARTLPVQVIGELFGVPEESRARLLRGAEVNVDTTISPEEAAANVKQWHQELHEFVEAKRADLGDDLTSRLVAARDEHGSRLTDSELLGTIHLVMATGTEPVGNLIGNTALALLRDPVQRGLLDNGQVSWGDVIEESLRAEAPVAHLPFRFAVEDVEIDEVVVRQGDPVLVNFAAAGRDPAVHGPSASRFDATRADKSHLSFGHGIYRCVGVPLARLEAEIALPTLFDRFPELTLAVPPDAVPPEVTFIMNGAAEIPVRLGITR